MAAVCFLRGYERLSICYEACSKSIARWLRTALGPEPERVFLLGNGDIVRSSFRGADLSGAFVYDPASYQIRPIDDAPCRRRPVPFVAITVHDGTDTIDLSEWVGEVRSALLPFPLTAAQLVNLWSNSYQTYISSNATIRYTTREGDEGVATRTSS
jgi:hypothetical protein